MAHQTSLVGGLSGLPKDLHGAIVEKLGDSGRAYSTTSVRARAAWEEAERRRLKDQPPAVAQLPLHQQQAFLNPVPLPVVLGARYRPLKKRLAPNVHIRTATRTKHFEVLLGSDGSAWGLRSRNSKRTPSECCHLLLPDPEPGLRPIVLSIACGSDHVALVCDGGALLVAGSGEGSLHGHALVKNPARLNFTQAELGGEKAVKVCAGDQRTYVLTEAGSIWGWGGAFVFFHGIEMEQWDDQYVPFVSQPRRVTVLCNGQPAPAFAQMAANDEVLCATDRMGGIYACGEEVMFPPGSALGGFHGLLSHMPPPPAPVRDVMAGVGGGIGLTLEIDLQAQQPRVVSDDASRKPSIGPLALLVDGTVWSILGQMRLPLCTGIISFAPDPSEGRLEMLKHDRRQVGVHPGDLYRLSSPQGWHRPIQSV
jgi:hypothetical protein